MRREGVGKKTSKKEMDNPSYLWHSMLILEGLSSSSFLDLWPLNMSSLKHYVCSSMQGGKGQWADYYTSPKSFIITFYYLLAQQLWWLLLKLDWLVQSVECPNVLNTDCNLQNGLFWISSLGNLYQFIGHSLIPQDPWVTSPPCFLCVFVCIHVYWTICIFLNF